MLRARLRETIKRHLTKDTARPPGIWRGHDPERDPYTNLVEMKTAQCQDADIDDDDYRDEKQREALADFYSSGEREGVGRLAASTEEAGGLEV